jgi:TonB family protein
MDVSKIGIALTLSLAAVVGTGAFRRQAVGAAGAKVVYVRGPADPDCPGELQRARASGDTGKLFLTEVSCRAHAGWKCPAICKGDELLVAHVAVKVQRNGQPADAQVVSNSESRAYDDMSVQALKAAAPFPAPPPALLDQSGAAPLKVEFACDCFERPNKPKK